MSLFTLHYVLVSWCCGKAFAALRFGGILVFWGLISASRFLVLLIWFCFRRIWPRNFGFGMLSIGPCEFPSSSDTVVASRKHKSAPSKASASPASPASSSSGDVWNELSELNTNDGTAMRNLENAVDGALDQQLPVSEGSGATTDAIQLTTPTTPTQPSTTSVFLQLL
jgi:hypothetical protein